MFKFDVYHRIMSLTKEKNIQIPSCADCTNDNKVFCVLSQLEKESLSENKGGNLFKKGQAIFYEGNHSSGLYCIYKGKVKLYKLGENGKEQVVRFAKSADILGYRSLLSDESYQATAIALEDTYVCHVSKEKFKELLTTNPKLSWGMLQHLAQDLKNAENKFVNANQKTVLERVAESLVTLHSTFGFKEDRKTLNVNLFRSEIADIAGTTTETTIRSLASLAKEGYIKLYKKEIEVTDLDGLIKVAKVF